MLRFVCSPRLGRRLGVAAFFAWAALTLGACLPLQFGVERPSPSPGTTPVAQTTAMGTPTARLSPTATPDPLTPAFGVTVTASPTDTPTPVSEATSSQTPANPTETPPGTPTTRPTTDPRTCALTHTVRQGERLSQIGQLYGVSWQDIATLNGLEEPGLIFAGQVLCLPPGARLPVTPTRTPTNTATPTPTLTPTSGTETPTTDPCLNAPAWFFTPTPPVCPTATAVTSQAAAQRFERGQMLWVSANDQYYVLFDGATASTRNLLPLAGPLDLKPGASPDNRVTETPPPGLEQPVSGFGLIWRGEVVGSEGVREALGWATQSEFAYTTTYQCQASTTAEWNCYLRGPGGQILRLYYTPNLGYFWDNW